MGGTRDDGFTAYVAGRRAHLFRTAYLLCGDPHRAEDIVQTALAKLYVAWPRASRADSVDAYVRRVIINSHLDETRRPWRRESPTEDDRLDRAAPAGVTPEDSDALWAALQAARPQAAPGGRAPPLLGALRRGDRRRPRRQPRHREEPDLGRPGEAPDRAR